MQDKGFEDKVLKFLKAVPNTEQKRGVGYDGTCEDGKRVEVKTDFVCKPGHNNIYIEYAQTTYQGDTYEPSGIYLNQSDYVSIVLPNHPKFYTPSEVRHCDDRDMETLVTGLGVSFSDCTILTIATSVLKELAEKHHVRKVRTRPGANGNRAGQHSLGYLLDVNKLRTCTGFVYIIEMSLQDYLDK